MTKSECRSRLFVACCAVGFRAGPAVATPGHRDFGTEIYKIILIIRFILFKDMNGSNHEWTRINTNPKKTNSFRVLVSIGVNSWLFLLLIRRDFGQNRRPQQNNSDNLVHSVQKTLRWCGIAGREVESHRLITVLRSLTLPSVKIMRLPCP
jgi:hypothetical protein